MNEIKYDSDLGLFVYSKICEILELQNPTLDMEIFLDSMCWMQLIIAIEDKYQVDVFIEDPSNVKTIKQAITALNFG